MRHEPKSKLASHATTAAMLLCTLSACGQPERPRTASDFCLNAKRLSAEPAPGSGMDDPGNRYDTDMTLAEVLAHNAVVDRLCPSGSGS